MSPAFEAATGNLLISGIGYFDNKPICLQVVDLGNACEDKLDAINTCVYYNREVMVLYKCDSTVRYRILVFKGSRY